MLLCVCLGVNGCFNVTEVQYGVARYCTYVAT